MIKDLPAREAIEILEKLLNVVMADLAEIKNSLLVHNILENLEMKAEKQIKPSMKESTVKNTVPEYKADFKKGKGNDKRK